ncbi:MAG: IclR family transcriptional regulator [Atribacterota bacterium]
MVTPLWRGIRIMEQLAKEGCLTLEELSLETKIPRSSTFRLLNTLEKLGYVERKKDIQGDQWSLGLKVLTLAGQKLSHLDLRQEIRDILEDLARETDEFVQLGVFHNGKVTYIDMVRRPKPLAFFADVGARLPINVSAAGLVLAAFLKEEDLAEVLQTQNLPQNTPYTITAPNELRKLLQKVAAQGYAIDDQMYAIGIRCVAAPVLNHVGQVVAAINITGSVSSMTDEKMGALVRSVKNAARKASLKLGYDLESERPLTGR